MKSRDSSSRLSLVTLAAVLACALPAAAAAQAGQRDTTQAKASGEKVVRLTPVTVTATRTEKDVFQTPTPVIVLEQQKLIEEAPNSITDLFREQPGLDVTGVGANQGRPSIRGQRGQRILLLEDGMRLSNSRRQQSFGELPALVSVNTVDRVEVVRGPASVLYGSDAIGGVINMITSTPEEEGIHGGASSRYGTQDDQKRVEGNVSGRVGRFSFRAGGNFRDTDSYQAPAGTFGDVTLDSNTTVLDTKLRDHAVDAYVGYDVGTGQRIFAKYERYRADTAGFGWIDPAAYAPNEALIQIRYPFQRFDKWTVGYRGEHLALPVADRVSVAGYHQDNQRELTNNLFIPFGGPPGAGLQVDSRNFTDIETFGLRLEASKFALDRVMFTYGADFFQDNSTNTDFSVNTMVGFGPIPPDSSDVPNIPNAVYRSAGVFLQGDIEIAPRLSLILGGRFQDVHAETRETAGITGPLLSDGDQTLVGAANAIFEVTDNLSLIGTVGRAFRSPNLVERFFEGPTPEGAGYQSRNPDLKPETSLNVDFGVRFRDRYVYLEGFVFQNEIRDGIVIAETGDSIGPLFEVRNENVAKLRFRGIELSGDLQLPAGFSVGAHYTHFDTKNLTPGLTAAENPVGDSFSSKIGGTARYTFPGELFWVEYQVRHNGERKDVDLGDPPIGPVLPAFTVHSARARVRVFNHGGVTQQLGIAVTNITNELYAEFSNASFFRPEARRGVMVTWDVTF